MQQGRKTVTQNKSFDKKDLYWRVFGVIYSIALFAINFIRIFDNNFWGDEAFSVGLARMNFGQMLTETALDVHPPLHYIEDMILTRIFGDHGWVYHLGALLPYAIILIFTLTVIWKKFGKECALILITFTSILSTSIQYNVEVRMYSLAAMFVLLSYYFLYGIISQGRRKDYICFVLTSLGAAYTHYYALITVAFYYLALLVWTIKKKIPVKNLIITYAVTILAYLPWGIVLISTLARTAGDFWMTEIPSVYDALLFIIEPENVVFTITIFSLLILISVFIIIASIKSKSETNNSHKSDFIQFPSATEGSFSLKSFLLWGWIALFGTLAMGFGVSYLVRPVFLIRYIYPAVVAFWLTISITLTRIKYKKIIAFVVILTTLQSSVPLYLIENEANREGTIRCDKTYEDLKTILKEGDVIWTNGGHLDWTILDCYFTGLNHTKINTRYIPTEFKIGDYILWTYDFDASARFWLEYRGIQVVEVYHDGLLGDNWIHLFRITNI